MNRLICISSALLVAGAAAFAQSSGSGGGSFANAYLIPTIVCTAANISTCSTSGGGQNGILWSNIQVPASKNVLLMASLETSLLTNTQVASSNGNKSTSTASGAVVVTPHLFPCTGSGATPCSSIGSEVVGAVTPSVVTFNQRQQTLSANLLGLGCTANATTRSSLVSGFRLRRVQTPSRRVRRPPLASGQAHWWTWLSSRRRPTPR